MIQVQQMNHEQGIIAVEKYGLASELGALPINRILIRGILAELSNYILENS